MAHLRISFGMIVLNGEPFIKYNLENLYPHAHEILIVEGAVERAWHAATSDGHSLDRTVEIIRSFPDPQRKIKLIQRNGFWSEKDEMSNAYMERCSGDYIWQVDVDEFYKTRDIEIVKNLLEKNPDVTRVDVKTVNFWRSFEAVMQGATYIFGADDFIRIFRFRPGFGYLTHRPPTLRDEEGSEVTHDRIVSAEELSQTHGVRMYHYSYVFPDLVRNKSEYYGKMNWGQGHEDGVAWFRDEWKTLSNPLRVHIINYPPSWIIPFVGEHPEAITKMLVEQKIKGDQEVVAFLGSEYRRYQRAGEKLTRIILQYDRGEVGKIRASMQFITALLLPLGTRSRRANRTIMKSLTTMFGDRWRKLYLETLKNRDAFRGAYETILADRDRWQKLYNETLENRDAYRQAYEAILADRDRWQKLYNETLENREAYKQAYETILTDRDRSQKLYNETLENREAYKQAYETILADRDRWQKLYNETIGNSKADR
ncbi:MAG TPA: glycosyltransferase family A protein [Bacteroidota bacterium]